MFWHVGVGQRSASTRRCRRRGGRFEGRQVPRHHERTSNRDSAAGSDESEEAMGIRDALKSLRGGEKGERAAKHKGEAGHHRRRSPGADLVRPRYDGSYLAAAALRRPGNGRRPTIPARRQGFRVDPTAASPGTGAAEPVPGRVHRGRPIQRATPIRANHQLRGARNGAGRILCAPDQRGGSQLRPNCISCSARIRRRQTPDRRSS